MAYTFNPLTGNFDYYQAGGSTSSWKAPVANQAALPATGNSVGDAIIAQDTGLAYEWNGTAWAILNPTLVGIFGSTPTANGIAIDPTTNTITLEPADATHPGAISIAAQTIAGAKTFTAAPVFNVAPKFNSLTASQPLQLDASKNVITGSIDINTQIVGVLPIANGGTNTSTPLNSNRMVITVGGKFVEQTIQTAARALVTDTNGLPVVSTVTTTELSFLSGATSNIQAQINALSPTGGDIPPTSFTAANNQASPANITGLVFPNASVKAFTADVSIAISATSSLFEHFTIKGIQRTSDWQIAVTSVGDSSGFSFSITTAGQMQYTSLNYTGFTAAAMRFRAALL